MADSAESGWIVEHGIGEKRALLMDGDTVLAAKVQWPGEARAGTTTMARLVFRPAGSSRGVARTGDGLEVLVDKLPRTAAEGREYMLYLTRAPIAERGRYKRAQGRIVNGDLADVPADLPEDVFTLGDAVRRFPAGSWGRRVDRRLGR